MPADWCGHQKDAHVSQALKTYEPVEEHDNTVAGRIVSASVETPQPARRSSAPQHSAESQEHVDPSALKRPTSRFGSVNNLVDRLTPRVDPRDDDLAFRRVLHDLQGEFPSESVLVAHQLVGLAADLLQAARMREAIEHLQNFDVYEQANLRAYEEQRQLAADHLAALTIMHLLDTGQSAIATPEAAKRLASCVSIRVRNLHEEFDPSDDEDELGDDAREDDDEFERELLAKREAVWRRVEPTVATLGDSAIVELLLDGSRDPTAPEREGLVAILDWLAPALQKPATLYELPVRNLMTTVRRNPQPALSGGPERVRQILLLDSGLRQVEKAIDNRVATLRKSAQTQQRRR